MRRPFSSTSVRTEVRPRSDTELMPPVVAPAALEAVIWPELASERPTSAAPRC
jgi:hypothetical protein